MTTDISYIEDKIIQVEKIVARIKGSELDDNEKFAIRTSLKEVAQATSSAHYKEALATEKKISLSISSL